MRRFTLPTLLCCCCSVASATAAEVQVFGSTYASTKKQEAAVETRPSIASAALPQRAVAARSATAEPTAARATAVQPTSRSAAQIASATTVYAKREFTYTDPAGQRSSAEILRGYQPKQIVYPFAKIDPKIDPKLRRAATIAQERARAHTRRRCWRYVKEALLASGVIDSYPKSVNAKEAGEELVRSYGFKRLPIRDPFAAPLGSVLVYYKGRNRPGHVELRTKDGFVSDFRSKTPDRHALLGVFAKRG